MPTLDNVLAPAPQVASRESQGELVVVLPEKGKFIVLNGTGAEVFQLMDGQRTLEEIATAVSEQYEAPLEQVQADVLTLAKKLLDRGVVLEPQK
jgi:4-diphosphocytidyl-2C-methyl-D-erythritol kinase